MAIQTEARHAGEHILSEVGSISREAITLISGQNLGAGAVLGRIEIAEASAVAGGGNTGNGVMGAITTSALAQEGDYSLSIKTAATNAGDFEVLDPQGDMVGTGTVGVAFSGGGLAFTLADGAADFAVGDTFVITVAAGSKKYTEHDPAASDGSQHAVGILYAAVDASLADAKGVAHERLVEVQGDSLSWKTGIAAGDKAAGIAHLKQAMVIVR